MIKAKLIVMTDHKPLLSLFKRPIVKDTVRDRRMFRYPVVMRNYYEWELHCIGGEKNIMAREALPVKEWVSPNSEFHLMALELLDQEEQDSVEMGKKLVKLCGSWATPTELGRVAQMARNDCVTCERCANFNHQHALAGNPEGTEFKPWDRFHSDSLSLPTTSENNGNLIITVDNGTNTVFLKYSESPSLKSCRSIRRVAAGHNEANGLAERIIGIVMMDMRKRVEETSEWDEHIDEWKFVFNTTLGSLGISPIELC
eukprot:Awhi_evm2s13783